MELLKNWSTNAARWFRTASRPKKIAVMAIVLLCMWLLGTKLFGTKKQATQYQTAAVERGTLIISVSGSGQVESSNNADVTTDATGVVKRVFVKNGDTVTMGEKIAEISLDQPGTQRMSAAYSSYQSASNNLQTAKANLYSTQSDMLTKWQTFMDVAQSSTYQNADGTPKTDMRNLSQFMTKNDDWLATEAKYKVQTSIISQTQTAQTAAWLSYLNSSPNIYAPIAGTVTGLSLQPGTVITGNANSSGNTTGSSGTKIASVVTQAAPTISINLTQIDIPKIAIGNKATISFDAFPDKTYTGKIISIDTTGSSSNGVTTYPTVLVLDTMVPGLYPNMTASANILTLTKDNVLLVPAAAVQSQNGTATVRILANGNIENRTVEIGQSSETQTEITSGLSEGETVVTSVVSSSSTTQRSTSPFSAFGGGGGAVFRAGGFGGSTTGGRRN